MPRTIVPATKVRSQQIAPGVLLECLHPGGKDGPNGEVLSDYPGGQTWSEMIMLGDPDDSFQLTVPDIRLPANQIWPLHWHDCWVGIVILEGSCLIGDWWMKPGDVLITEASLEYGPLLIGPKGCRMFEVFAKLHLSPGGYGPEYRDHPTLQGGTQPFTFKEREGVNKRNEGHSTLPIDGIEGFTKGSFTPGSQWDLGTSDDPERGIMRVSRLSPGQRLPASSYEDWHTTIVFDGSLNVGGKTLGKDDYLVMRPNSPVGEIEAGPDGALVLDVARTARGIDARPMS
jgi:hypothetical protein